MKKKAFHLRLPQLAIEALKENAELCSMSVSAYARALIQGKRPREALPPEAIEVLRQLRLVQNNLDQIATVANMFDLEDAGVYHNISKDFAKHTRLLARELVRKTERPCHGDREDLAG